MLIRARMGVSADGSSCRDCPNVTSAAIPAVMPAHDHRATMVMYPVAPRNSFLGSIYPFGPATRVPIPGRPRRVLPL